MLTILLVALIVHTGAVTAKQTLAELPPLNETCKGEELCGPGHPNDASAKCSCEEDCAKYGDCCRNSPFFSTEHTMSTVFACVATPPRGHAFYMVAKCPANADPVLRQLCEKPKPSPDPVANNLPVTVPSPKGFTTYLNVNCAKCHNAPLTSAQVWPPFLQCYDNHVTDIPENQTKVNWNATTEEWTVLGPNERILYRNCKFNFNAPLELDLKDLRTCRDEGFVDTCLPAWKKTNEERMCHSYTAFVVANSTSYRNVYCAKCNNEVEAAVVCVDIGTRSFGGDATFANLLRDPGAGREQCQINEVYDTIFKKCRSLVCSGRKECGVEDNAVPKGVNVSRIQDCSRIVLEKGTFEMRDGNRTVWVEQYGRNFSEGSFLVDEKGQVEICVEDLPKKFDRYSFAMGIVTVVGLGLSIFFLVLHLFAVVLVPELRNLSGMNLASLCVALLGAYVSFIAGAFLSGTQGGPRQSCTIVAVLTYFFFMSAFFWMLIIAFDVWRVLRWTVRHFRTSSGRQYCRFLSYSLYSWGVPAVLTVTVILVETAPEGQVDDRFRPRFGVETCWFSRRLSLVAFFAMPLAVIMVLNVIFFVSSAFMILTSRFSPSSSNVSGQKRDFRLYLRLAILLGLTWVVGLIAAVTDYEPLWIIFVMFNTLQGLFIFAVFTCTSKVLNGLTRPHPWANRWLGSAKPPPSKPTNIPSSDGLSQSTSDMTLKSSSNNPSGEMSSQARETLPQSRKSNTHLEVTGLPRRLP